MFIGYTSISVILWNFPGGFARFSKPVDFAEILAWFRQACCTRCRTCGVFHRFQFSVYRSIYLQRLHVSNFFCCSIPRHRCSLNNFVCRCVYLVFVLIFLVRVIPLNVNHRLFCGSCECIDWAENSLDKQIVSSVSMEIFSRFFC